MSSGFRRRAATLLALVLCLVVILPASAAGPSLRDSDAKAPDGRLVVVWRGEAPDRIDVPGMARSIPSRQAQRTVAVAEEGQAAALAARLRADPRVLAVVPDAVVKSLDFPADGAPDDPQFEDQEDLPQIGVPSVWPTTTGDSDLVVAIIDSGFDLDHPDLAGVSVVAPRNETWNSTDITDTYGHGTHVAGTIFARTNNATGIAGIAPDVTFMPIKVLDDGGFGWISDVLDAVDWARTHGADIINLSLGGTLEREQIALFQSTFSAARAEGILVVAAAGNGGSPQMYYPAGLQGVVSVAAVDAADEAAWFSTYNRAVDIAAPGVDTLSTSLDAPSRYARESGTSMASPHVVGVAALVWSARPELTVGELEAVLRTSALDLGDPGRDNVFGSGRIDAAAALTGDVPDPLPDLEPAPPKFAEPLEITFTSPAAPVSQTSASFSLAWTTNHEVIDGIVLRYAWKTVGGVCPDEFEADPYDFLVLDYASPSLNTGLAGGSCYRWEVFAVDEEAEAADEISHPVTVVDRTRPAITKRVPTSGQTGVARSTSVRITFSEAVRGVSGTTLRLKNLTTGLYVRAKVTYSATKRTATIDPVLSMYGATRYRVYVRSGIRDLAGNALPATYWTFKTAR